MGSGRIVVEAESRPVRRALPAVAWVVLEEVALSAEADGNGRLVATTSARRLAEVLAIDAGTAAGALRQLRRRGLLGLERHPGLAGRFGLSIYTLAPPPGLVVLGPCGVLPHVAIPHVASGGPPTRPSGRPPSSDHPALDLGWSDS